MATTPALKKTSKEPRKFDPLSQSTLEDEKYKRKYKDLKRRVRGIEEDNDVLNLKLVRAKENIRRLRVERGLLFDKLDNIMYDTDDHASSDSASDSNLESRIQKRARLLKTRRTLEKPPPPPKTLATHTSHAKQTKIGGASAAISGAHESSSTHPLRAAPGKRNKDPDAPRGPSNAFFIYSQMHRPQVKKEHSDLGHYEIARHLGQMWKDLSHEEKQVYVDLASQDRERYEQEMSSYQHHHSDAVEGMSPPGGVRHGSEDLSSVSHDHRDLKTKSQNDVHKNGHREGVLMAKEEDEQEIDELMEDE
ncbi:hypothetical protein BGX28_006347 [Mortierella sp. GBA30]|nr:hypothetical protein BGX28_006347 [Mortierella sp. GBA30]